MDEREKLITQANEAHAQWPQYAGHWDDWQVGTITHRVKTKGGVRFEAGDRVLVKPNDPSRAWLGGNSFRTAYSWRGHIDCSVPATWVQLDQEITPCMFRQPHQPHGDCLGIAPEYPWETVYKITDDGPEPVNRNILEGWACPECGQTKEFKVEAETMATVTDNGAEAGDLEWSQDSYAQCPACFYDGIVESFCPTKPIGK